MGCDIFIKAKKHEMSLVCYCCGREITVDENGDVIGHERCRHGRDGEEVISCNIETNGSFR